MSIIVTRTSYHSDMSIGVGKTYLYIELHYTSIYDRS